MNVSKQTSNQELYQSLLEGSNAEKQLSFKDIQEDIKISNNPNSYRQFDDEEGERQEEQVNADREIQINVKPLLGDFNFTVILVILMIIAFFGTISSLIIAYWQPLTEAVQPFFEWYKRNLYLGMLYYVLLYTVWVVFMFPAMIVTLAGAFTLAEVFGPLLAFPIALLLIVIGATLGGLCAFGIGRFLAKDFIYQLVIKKVRIIRAIDYGLRDNGFKLITLMRMTPIIPYNFFNYAISVTQVSVKDFLMGSVGMFPMSSIYVYVAVNLKSISQIIDGDYELGKLYLVLITFGGCALVYLITTLIKIAREELIQLIEEEQQRDNPKFNQNQQA